MCLGSNGGTDEEAGSRTANVRLRHTAKENEATPTTAAYQKVIYFSEIVCWEKSIAAV